MRWGMVIDRKRCIGCYACMVSCKQSHALPPELFWNRVLISETGTYPMVTKQILPVICNHCKEAACVVVCPTGATEKREADGIVWVDPDKCVGCRYCLIACPYQMRTYHADNRKEYWPDKGLSELERFGREEFYPLQPKTVIKCNFCMERLEEGQRKGLQVGIDREATPICVNACPVKARIFGDLDDPGSNVSKLIKERRGYPLHPEYGTEPSVHYLD
ncbi:4Fe-4S dicluster domain-containing protein [Thermodesulfobacteriota bacterium]